MIIPLVVQHRHIHLSRTDLRALFGDEKNLTIESKLAHRGQFVYQETVAVIGSRGEIKQVKILGPCREQTQVELSVTDTAAIGTRTVMRQSGDTAKSGSCKLRGPNGIIKATSTVIVPARHLHCDPPFAKKWKLKNHSTISLEHAERNDLVIHHVFVRIHPSFALEFHLNEDEAAEFWIKSGDPFLLCS